MSQLPSFVLVPRSLVGLVIHGDNLVALAQPVHMVRKKYGRSRLAGFRVRVAPMTLSKGLDAFRNSRCPVNRNGVS